jgi:hypothetical protein
VKINFSHPIPNTEILDQRTEVIMCPPITQQNIDNNAVKFLENGNIKFKGHVYKEEDCDFSDLTLPQKMQDEESPKVKKEKKQKKVKHQEPVDHKVQDDEELPEQSDVKEMSDMGLPVQAPQDGVTAAPAPTPAMTPEQMQALFQMMAKAQAQAQAQPVTAVPAPVTPVHPSAPGETTTEIPKSVVPEELHLFKQMLELTGGNAIVAILLVAAFVYMKFLKGNLPGQKAVEEKNEEQDEKISEHTDACDADRRDLSTRVAQLEAKISLVDTKSIKTTNAALEAKAKKITELDNRLSDLEEHLESGLDLGLSDEAEQRLSSLEKQIKALSKNSASHTKEDVTSKAVTTKKAKTKANVSEESDEDEV